MWSDELNKKIQEGENRNLPDYSESDWEKMEQLLNKHLPLERKRRRGLILFLLSLLVTTGIIVVNWPLVKHTSSPVTMNESAQIHSSIPRKSGEKTNSRNPDNVLPIGDINAAEKTETSGNITLKGTSARVKTPNNTAEHISGNENPDLPVVASYNRKTTEKTDSPFLQIKRNSGTVNPPQAFETPVKEQSNNAAAIEADEKSVAGETRDITPADAVIIPENKTDSAYTDNKFDSISNETAEPLSPIQQKRSGGSRLALHLALGPDISMVGFDRPGRVQLQYGLGISYEISSRLHVRTGLFAGDKVYSASPGDYKVPYPIHNLEKVEADCYIYEIPVGLLYTFNPGSKNNWMAGTSVSSYIMKKETYGYYYRNYSGQPQYYERSYTNENKHFFSVLAISGGYRHQVNNRFSLMAEPYIKLPLGGIGVGKVRLNNAGVMFSIGYKPFLSK